MIKATVVLFILALAAIQSVYCKSILSSRKPCKRRDPALNKCVKEFMQSLINQSPKGIPDIKLPPMEPFVIPKVTLDQGNSESVKLKATFNDLTAHGLTKSETTDAKVTLEPEPSIEFNFVTPAVRMESNYIIDGKILVVPIKGSGRSHINLTDTTANAKLSGKYVEKNGKKHIQLTKYDVDINVNNAHFYFENLFNGNKQLGDTTNAFLNENWREIYKEVKPVIAETVGIVASTILKNVFDKYTFDELFPEK